MRLLFIHRIVPGQFGPLLDALVRNGGHQLVFVTQAGQVGLPGVTVVPYVVAPSSFRVHADARPFDEAMRRAASVADVARGLHQAGFVPDLIIGHEGWGETLNLRDVWPGVPQIGYREFFYHEAGADVGHDPEFPVAPSQLAGVRARNAVLALALLQGHAGATPTAWQRGLYPDWAQPGIRLVPDGVALETCRPDPAARTQPFRLGALTIAPEEQLVTFVARDLEPYRGFHTLMRALPSLLSRPGLRVVCLGRDGISYGRPPPTGTWRSHLLAELAGQLDPARLHFPGWVGYADHVRLLQRSEVHLYLSYPFIASWSLREALACGCCVVAADTAPVRELIEDGVTGRLVPALDPAATAATVGSLLDDPPQRARLGAAARDWAERTLRPEAHLAAWRALIAEVSNHDPGV